MIDMQQNFPEILGSSDKHVYNYTYIGMNVQQVLTFAKTSFTEQLIQANNNTTVSFLWPITNIATVEL